MLRLPKTPFAPCSLGAVAAVLFATPALLAGAESPQEVPLQFIHSIPAVEVKLNGQGPFLFGIDTGAQGQARIDSSVAAKLGIAPAGEALATDGGRRGPQKIQLVKLETLEIAGQRFADVTAGARNLKAMPRLSELDGLVGLDLFAGYLVTLDFPGKALRLTRGELPPADGKEIIAAQLDGGIFTVPLAVGGTETPAHLDSGNVIGPFVLPTSMAEQLKPLSEPAVVGRARSLSGDIEIKQLRVQETFRLGRHEFREPLVTHPALGDVVNIGAKALQDFAVTFDLKNSRVRFVRAVETPGSPSATDAKTRVW